MGQVMSAAIPGSAWYTSAMGYAQVFARLGGVSGGLVATQRADGTVNAVIPWFPNPIFGEIAGCCHQRLVKADACSSEIWQCVSLIVERRQMVVAISQQHALDTDQYLVRGTERMDIVNHSVGDSVNRGPVAMLMGTT